MTLHYNGAKYMGAVKSECAEPLLCALPRFKLNGGRYDWLNCTEIAAFGCTKNRTIIGSAEAQLLKTGSEGLTGGHSPADNQKKCQDKPWLRYLINTSP
jgi:hypothetical protein